jgi:xanthine dehydrogenase YagR molybdenum-binding subunit
VAAALRGSVHQVDQRYVQPARHHNPMETSACLASWQGDELTLHDAVQAGANVPPVMAAAFGIPAAKVRVVCPHTGGGFGCKGYVWPHQVLAAAAARVAGRPVRLALTRSQMYAMVGYQPLVEQRLAVGCDAGGRLTALLHEAMNTTAVADDHLEPATEIAKGLYPAPALRTRQWLQRVNANLPTAMRAPVEGVGAWALESAMDELSRALRVDPLDLRLANDAKVDPLHGKPWSSKKLREAYEEGARLYGWRERHARPRQDGAWRIGHGMATCTMGTFRFPSQARITLHADGRAHVETATHDIGTGITTVLTQLAAQALQLSPQQVSVAWGDTRLPPAGPVYGSSATIGTGSAVQAAAIELRSALEQRLGRPLGDTTPLQALQQLKLDSLDAEGRFALPGDAPFNADGANTPYAMRTWGAVFVEVGVDPELGLVRLRRAVGSYSAGRILNPKTAQSQMTGGLIWGWGKATMEQSVQEPRFGRWLAKNLSNVAIPVNADIPTDITIHFVDEVDPHASTIGARGIGELGASGVDAAVANAVFDAVGVRVRELPITPSRLLPLLLDSRRAAA